MIVVYAEKEDMGIRYAAALGGIMYKGKLVKTDDLTGYISDIKKEIADKVGYLETTYEGKKYIVTWGWGHFGTLKDIKDYNPEYDKWYKIPLPFIPTKYESKRIENKNEYFKKRDDRQFKIVTDLFNRSDCEYIVNATDWEREGELIFAYVYDLTKTAKPYLRLRNTAKTEKEIRKAFANLVDAKENYPYVVAARARSIADWCIGVNMTIAATIYLSGGKSLLNIGRVMTPTLNLITDREKAIKNFKESTSYGIEGEFDKGYKGTMEGDLFAAKQEADAVISDLSPEGRISSVTKKKERKRPPLLHNTNTLQIEANELYGYTLQETLDAAQKLYELGHITYPRVDSQYLTEDKKSEIPSLMSLLMSTPKYSEYAGPTVMPDRYFDNSKIDGHDAIIITDNIPKNLSPVLEDVYDLVARRMLAAVSKDVIYEKTTVMTEVMCNGEPILFKTSGIVYEEKGWAVPAKKELKDNALPDLHEGDKVSGKYSIYEQVAKPPKRYTDATLIKAMENCGRKMEDAEAREYLKKSKGIGRPATRAALVERLVKAGYVERKGKSLIPTDKGMSTIDAIPIDDIKSPLLTADWEKSLDEIESSKPAECIPKLKTFIGSIHGAAKKWCEELREHKIEVAGAGNSNDIGAKCPVCGSPLLEGKDNYYCSGYKDGCRFSIRKVIAGKKITRSMAKTLAVKGETDKYKGFKGNSGKVFDAKLKLSPAWRCPSCNTLQPEGTCYKCKGELVPDKCKIVTFKFEAKKGA